MSIADLDPLIHSRIRLAIMVVLAEVELADFNYLKDATGATDGNLSTHLSKLETAGYVQVTKGFVGKKPRTIFRMTPTGRSAFATYLHILRASLPKEEERPIPMGSPDTR